MNKSVEEVQEEIIERIRQKKEAGEPLGFGDSIHNWLIESNKKAKERLKRSEVKMEKQTLLLRMAGTPKKSLTREEIEFLRAYEAEEKRQWEEKKGTLWYTVWNYLKEQHEKSWGKRKTGVEKAIEKAEKMGVLEAPSEEGVDLNPSESACHKSEEVNKTHSAKDSAPAEEGPTTQSVEETKPIVIPVEEVRTETECPEKEPFSTVFVGGGGIFGVSLCIFLLCALLSLVPIINLLALPLGFVAGCAMLFVAPLVMLRDFLRWMSGTRVIPTEKQFQKTLEEYAVEGRKKQIIQEEAERKAAERIDQAAREQLETEKEAKQEKDIKNMKVDLGFGKKVKFEDLPKSLQEQILKQQQEEEKQEE